MALSLICKVEQLIYSVLKGCHKGAAQPKYAVKDSEGIEVLMSPSHMDNRRKEYFNELLNFIDKR